jgi:hypothetical protein
MLLAEGFRTRVRLPPPPPLNFKSFKYFALEIGVWGPSVGEKPGSSAGLFSFPAGEFFSVERGELNERAETAAHSSGAHFEESSFASPVPLPDGAGGDPGGLPEDPFQDRKRAGRRHSGDGLAAFPRLQYHSRPLLGIQQEYDLWNARNDSKEWRQVKAFREAAAAAE